MTKVTDLPRGWSLYVTDECHEISVMPIFVRKDGAKRRSWEVAALPEAHVIFRDLKRKLDIADRTHRLDDFWFRGLDMARFSLELALRDRALFDPELRRSGIEVTV